jgi:outer membrane protein assembly factor BamD
VDDAQFQLAEAYFYSEDYVSAAFEYERIREDFPLSPLVDDAQFRLGLCYFRESPRAELEQENTYRAIEEFVRFIQDYPQSPQVEKAQEKIVECRAKLAKKEYLNGKFYLKAGDYDASLVYFREVLSTFGDTKWAAYAQFGIGEALFRKEAYEDALQAYQGIGDTPSSLKNKAEKRISEIQDLQDPDR